MVPFKRSLWPATLEARWRFRPARRSPHGVRPACRRSLRAHVRSARAARCRAIRRSRGPRAFASWFATRRRQEWVPSWFPEAPRRRRAQANGLRSPARAPRPSWAVSALLGWVTPWRGLASISPASIPMAPSTALALLLLGATLILEARRRSPRLTTAVSLLVLIFACVQLADVPRGSSADARRTLRLPIPTRFGGVPTGRMSPLTSLGLLLASLSLLFIGLCQRPSRARRRRAEAWLSPSACSASSSRSDTCSARRSCTAARSFPWPSRRRWPWGASGWRLVGLTPRDSAPLRPFTGSSARARLLRAFLPVAPAIVVVEAPVRPGRRAEPGPGRGAHGPAVGLRGGRRRLLRGPWRRSGAGARAGRTRALAARRRSTGCDRAVLFGCHLRQEPGRNDRRLERERGAAVRLRPGRGPGPVGEDPRAARRRGRADRDPREDRRRRAHRATRRRTGCAKTAPGARLPVRIAFARRRRPRRGRLGHRARRVGAEARREGAARERERRCAPSSSRTSCGILFGDIRGGIQDANQQLLRMFRLHPRRPARGPPLERRHSAGVPAPGRGTHREARARGACAPYEKQYIRKDGRRLWVLVGYVLLEPRTASDPWRSCSTSTPGSGRKTISASPRSASRGSSNRA